MNREATETIKRRYDRMAPMFHKMDDKSMKDLRKNLLAEVKGSVLEFGVGTGANLPYYRRDIRLTGIDFSPNMLQYAREKAKSLDFPVTLLEMDVEQLEFPLGMQAGRAGAPA
ncbi:class I SAM-dependent methyltransferase [Paenibacillus sp. BR2-3]|uniref:class I SAM-dependent methyltransferase n=1 Tax=Paenibacillus sp. BR2-3 TaxID=3048494 RepID=UPI003977AB87